MTSVSQLIIRPGDLGDSRVRALLAAHATRARAETARGSAHALDLDGFLAPDIQLWAAFANDDPVGVGALRQLDSCQGELKSFYTEPASRRRGVARHILTHIMDAARVHGMRRLSLETGSWPYFAPARIFYSRHGFLPCDPFGDYAEDPNSIFMTRVL